MLTDSCRMTEEIGDNGSEGEGLLGSITKEEVEQECSDIINLPSSSEDDES